MHKVSIIGGGVAGLTIARVLKDRACEVTLYDKVGEPGPQACSWWAGGMLAPHCEAESAEEPIVRLGSEAANWWQAKTGLVSINGSLVISPTRDQADIKRFATRTTNFKHLNGQEITELEPDLGSKFSKALYFETEAHLPPRAALQELRNSLIADGITFITEEIDPLSHSKQELTLDCRGYAAKSDLNDLRGVKGEMLILSCPEISFSRSIRLLHPRIPLYVVPRGDGIYMLGATQIEASAGKHVTARSMLELLSAAYTLNPAFGEAEILEIGVDSRPAFPDNLPRIRRNKNLIQVNGLFRHGFLLAPAIARMVGDMVLDNKKPEVADEYSA